MKIELMTRWYNEEVLAPFFLKHYQFVDKIHLFLDTDTDDKTLEKIDLAKREHDNIQVYDFKFPDKVNDIIARDHFNDFYKTLNCDYVFLVDADEFIFYPEGYLEKDPHIIHFTKLWNVYRHITDKDLDINISVQEQRRHGVSDLEGWDIYTKVNIAKVGLDFWWEAGMHSAYLNGNLIDWTRIPHGWLPPGVSWTPLMGAHWPNADPCFSIQRRLNRCLRQSEYNLTHGLSTQHHGVTEDKIVSLLKSHENDPRVI